MAGAPKATQIKLAELEDEEQREIKATGLWELYCIMNKTIDEAIAEEAVTNYDKEANETRIKGVTVKASKETLNKYLGLSAQAEGEPWSADMMSKHLGET